MSGTPYGSDESDLDEAGPSTRRHFDTSSQKADPDVLAPITDLGLASRRVHYYHSPLIGSFSYGYGHPMKPHRMRMAHSLVTAYGLDQCMTVRMPKEADKVDMTRFHTDEYIDFLERVNPENGMALTGQGTRFLIGEDCPAFPSVFQFCSLSSGGSISAAHSINSGAADIAINWAGGLHHAKKREASGFCYTNDIVLGILELLRVHSRVLYIDIDIHHGDGVEEAFYATNRVMTLSFHKFGDFFPGTGDVKDVGYGEGKGYAVNVPLRDGVGDREYQDLLFRPVIQHIMDWYRPGAVVLQCGADSLAGDKLGCFNLSMRGHAACVSFLQSFNVPLICVGGGGYTVRNVARTWTYETALLLGRQPDEDLPFNDYMNWFGPEYKLDVRPTSMENLNSDAYLEGLRTRIIDNLRSLPFAPSVQQQPTPRHAMNAHAEGDLSDSEEEGGDLEKRISKRLRQAQLQSQIDSPLSDSDSEADEEEGEDDPCGVAHASSSASSSASALKRSISSASSRRFDSHSIMYHGNPSSLDDRRRRTIFEREREGSVSSLGSTSKSWLGMGYTPSGLGSARGAGAAGGGPPELLRRILASKGLRSHSRLGGGAAGGGFDSDADGEESDVGHGDDEDEDERDRDRDEYHDDYVDDVEDERDVVLDGADGAGEDGRSALGTTGMGTGTGTGTGTGMDLDSRSMRASTSGGQSHRAGANGHGNADPRTLTKLGRPKRSFFDNARPYAPSLNPRTFTNVRSNGTTVTVTIHEDHQRPPTATAHAHAHAPDGTRTQGGDGDGDGDVIMELGGDAAAQDEREREREIERGRRGEGGGSEVDLGGGVGAHKPNGAAPRRRGEDTEMAGL